MARPGISKSEVFEKANQLIGEGIDPTIEQIRSRLGTGSNSTIAGYLREWRALQKGEQTAELSDDLPAEFIGLMKGLWQRLSSQAEEKVISMKQDFDSKIAESGSLLDALNNMHAELQQHCQKITDEKTTLSIEKKELEQGIQKKRHEIAALNEKQNSLITQLDEKQELILELRRLHRQAQENLEHYRNEARDQRKLDEERFAREKNILEVSIKESHQALQTALQEQILWEKNYEKISHEKTLLQSEYDKKINSLEQLQKSFQKLEQDHHTEMRLFENERKQNEILKKKWDEQSNVLIEAKKENAVLFQQVQDLCEKISILMEQNKMLINDKLVLSQEKVMLLAQLKQESINV